MFRIIVLWQFKSICVISVIGLPVKISDDTNGRVVLTDYPFSVSCFSSFPSVWAVNGEPGVPSALNITVTNTRINGSGEFSRGILRAAFLYRSTLRIEQATSSHGGKYECFVDHPTIGRLSDAAVFKVIQRQALRSPDARLGHNVSAPGPLPTSVAPHHSVQMEVSKQKRRVRDLSNALVCEQNEIRYQVHTSKLILACKTTSQAATSISWKFTDYDRYYNKTPLVTSGVEKRHQVIFSGHDIQLVISPAKDVDTGFYECSAAFPDGTTVSQVGE